jgi:hypothetical protein
MKKREGETQENPLDGDEHLVFKDLTTLLVQTARVVTQVEKPGSGELVSYLVVSEIGARPVELLVRVCPTRRSYACWQVQEAGDKYMHMLGTFGAGVA